MSARENILNRIKKNQPTQQDETVPIVPAIQYGNPGDKFRATLISIGGSVIDVQDLGQIKTFITTNFPSARRIVSTVNELNGSDVSIDPRDYSNVDIAILCGSIAVAENGSVWIDNKEMIDHVIPFICEHLMLIIKPSTIVHNLAQAYEIFQDHIYDYGTFIAGPSKTADIEQSLVLGAHGAKSLTVFILQ